MITIFKIVREGKKNQFFLIQISGTIYSLTYSEIVGKQEKAWIKKILQKRDLEVSFYKTNFF